MVKKDLFVVTIVGAESSGKTVLVKQLAEALGCKWVPEFAREYLEKLERSYTIDDLTEIAKGQWAMINPEHFIDNPIPKSSTISEIDILKRDGVETKDFILALKSLEREILIIDSGMLTIRMWARIKYGLQLGFVEDVMKKEPTSLYLLSRPRMEWERDPLREAPSLLDRVWIYNQYLKELIEQEFNFYIIKT